MTQTQLNYLAKCVIPNVIGVDVYDDDTLSVHYTNEHGNNTITVTLIEYENACSRCDRDGWAQALLTQLQDKYTIQESMGQYDI